MRAIIQRVSQATVTVDGLQVGACGPGLLLLVGVHRDDEPTAAVKLAGKIAGLRIFNDGNGKMNLSLLDLPPSNLPNVLAISNFTVYGDATKNRRPSFMNSAPFDAAKSLFDLFVFELQTHALIVETGAFGEHMEVALTNDGPVTLTIDV